jgi:hypothetical protein
LKEIMGDTFLDDGNYSRFAIVNVWRPISAIVENWPLTICDSTTVLVDKDVVSVPRFSNDGRKGEIQMAYYSAMHKWYYFPKMTNQEIILLKTYDSSLDMNRFTIHTAFDENWTRESATSSPQTNVTSRESIETRAFVFYK